MLNKKVILILGYCLLCTGAYAFDNQSTHRLLTQNAVEHSIYFEDFLVKQFNTSEGVKKQLNNGSDNFSIEKWLQEGSQEEDEPLCRAANHFHNPLKPWTESKLTDTFWLTELICDATSPFLKNYSNIYWATGFTDSDQTLLDPPVNDVFAPDSDENGRNWSVARKLFYDALTETDLQRRELLFAETFRTIG